MIQAEQVRTSEPAARRAPAIAPSESAAAPSRCAWVGPLSVKRLSAVYLWVLFIILFGVITPDTFLTETTFRLVFRSGVITCVPYAVVGALLVAAVWREFRREAGSSHRAFATANR